MVYSLGSRGFVIICSIRWQRLKNFGKMAKISQLLMSDFTVLGALLASYENFGNPCGMSLLGSGPCEEFFRINKIL